MADEIIRLDYSAEDIGDNIDEVRTARGEYDSLDERLDEIEGGGFTPTQAQLDAINSGITDDDVEQIDLNKNNILTVADQSTQYNYMDFNSYGTGNSGTIDSINTTTNTITVSGKAAWAKGIIYLNNVPSGTYRLKYTVSSNSSASAVITMNEGSTQKTSKVWNNSTGDYTSGKITFGDNVKSLYITANNSTSTLTNSATITITNVMLIPTSVYDAGFTDYQPYAMSNVELTDKINKIGIVKIIEPITPSAANTYECITASKITLPAGKILRLTASCIYQNSYATGIAIVRGATKESNKTLAVSESTTDYIALSASTVCSFGSNQDIYVFLKCNSTDATKLVMAYDIISP